MAQSDRLIRAMAEYIIASGKEETQAARKRIRELLDAPPDPAELFQTDANSLDDMIRFALRNLGVPGHILGYGYLVTALTIAVNEPDALRAITKDLYLRIAKKHDTTVSRAERGIRHAIELCWSRGDIEVLTECFGNTVSPNKGKPTNSEFIACIAESIRRQME